MGVLNQYYQNLQGLGSEMVNQRCLQWKNILYQKGVDNVIVFDAHWDKRSKEKQIYDAIYKVLDDNQKSDFSDGIQKFKERQNEIREEVCLALADSIENLQKINIKVKKAEYESDQKEKYREKVINIINRETVKFIAYVSKLYEVAAEYPTDSSKDLIVKANNRISVPGRIAMSTGGSAFLSTFGAIFGGVLGAIVVGFLSGGAGIIPGAIQGAQVLGAIGAGLGALAIFGDDGDQIDIRMTSLQIEDIVKSLLAIVWGLEHNGFGRDRELSAKEVEDMKSLINELHTKQMIYDWTRINQGEVIRYCKNMLIKLEDY